MSRLQTIQKIFKVFQVFMRIAMWVLILAVICSALAVVFGQIMFSEISEWGVVKDVFEQNRLTLGKNEVLVLSLCSLILCFADCIVCMYACHYLKHERRDGTPFTEKGAIMLRKLGVLTIVFPLIAVIANIIICDVADLNLKGAFNWDNKESVTTGIVLLIVSVIFQYGAELKPAKLQGESTEKVTENISGSNQ